MATDPPEGPIVNLQIEASSPLARLSLPEGVERRLHALLNQQDRGEQLTEDERLEAEGLVDVADFLSLLRLRSAA